MYFCKKICYLAESMKRENMEKPVLSPNFTIEDIHKLREYNYEMTKHITDEERMDYYNKAGRAVQRKLEKMKAL